MSPRYWSIADQRLEVERENSNVEHGSWMLNYKTPMTNKKTRMFNVDYSKSNLTNS